LRNKKSQLLGKDNLLNKNELIITRFFRKKNGVKMGVSENDDEFLANLEKKNNKKDKLDNQFAKKESKIYDRVTSVKEIESSEKSLLEGNIKEKDSFEKLRELAEPTVGNKEKINYTEKPSEKKIVLEEKQSKVSEKEFLGTKSDKPNKLEKFSWEERDQIDKPVETDFEEIIDIEKDDLKQSKERQRQAMDFEWEKKEQIDKPTTEDFDEENIKHPELKDERRSKTEDFEWLKKEITKNEPDASKKKSQNLKEKEFEENIKSKIAREFDWEKKEQIEIPTEKDFAGNVTGHPKWKHGKTSDSMLKKDKNLPLEEKKLETKTKESKKEKIVRHPKWIEENNVKQDAGEKSDTKEKAGDENAFIETSIDVMFRELEKKGKVDSGKIASLTNTPYKVIETIAKVLEDYGIIAVHYPTSLSKKPRLELKKKVVSRVRAQPKGEIIDTYKLTVDSVQTNIAILRVTNETRPIYAVSNPAIGRYTKKFLDFIKDEIAETIPIELEEITNPKKSKPLKKRFFEESQKHLKKYFPNETKSTLNTLSGTILHEMYGLGPIEVILGDDMLEEVAINSSKTPITIYHRVHGWLKTNLLPGTEDEIMNYASQIGRKVGRDITILNPILDAHLLSGDRVNATLFPITAEGNTLTIRRFARRPWTIVDFVGKAHTMSAEMAALLWLAMQYELNVIISGGTASGKTSTLNTLLALIPSYHRTISIEDVREIVLPKYLDWNWIPMITRSANPEGLGEVTMLDCMITSLRMRPDRIIVGEMRRKREAEVLMEAIETGHSIYSTIHANSAYQVLRRLAEPPMSIPLMQIELVDLIVVQFRDRKTNKRRTLEIAEIEQTSTGKGLQINTIYKWMPRSDTWEQLNRPTKLLTLLNLHTGLTEEEIDTELKNRTTILNWLKEKNIADLNEIGFIMKVFYSNPKKVIEMAEKKISREKLKELIE
jgi:archaeal flagellar protein FlaI